MLNNMINKRIFNKLFIIGNVYNPATNSLSSQTILGNIIKNRIQNMEKPSLLLPLPILPYHHARNQYTPTKPYL